MQNGGITQPFLWTRTTAVFTIQYLRYMGLDVNNDLFPKHSWYFRNALVCANYSNVAKHIERTSIYLERFFRNLLLGEEWVLKNRYLIVDPPVEYAVQPRLDTSTSTQDFQNLVNARVFQAAVSRLTNNIQ